MRHAAKRWLDRRYRLSEWSPHDLLRLDQGFALARFVVPEDSPALGRKLSELRLKDHVVQVLTIERGDAFHPVPRGEDRFQARDRLVVFGRAESIEHLFEPAQAEALGVVETAEPFESGEPGGPVAST